MFDVDISDSDLAAIVNELDEILNDCQLPMSSEPTQTGGNSLALPSSKCTFNFDDRHSNTLL